MNNCAGINRDIIVSKEAFEQLVRSSIQQLHSPTQQCLSMVTRELLQIAQEAEPVEALRCAGLTVHGTLWFSDRSSCTMLLLYY
jgi:hypothetical protein